MTHPLQSRAARPTPAFRRARRIALAVIAFLSATAFAAAQSALPIFVADFNHDGIPDALVLSTSAPTGTVALGSVPYGTFSANASGLTFPAACTSLYTGTGGAAPIVIADVNNDGFPDIVFRCRTNPQLGADGLAGVMLGNGDGTFAAPVTLPTYISTETVVADFDGDGKLDVVLVGQLASSSYGLLFYKGNGDGTFAAPASLNFGTSSAFNPNFVIESAAAADVNGDGYLDLVTESIFSPGSDPTGAPRILSVFGNNKDGTFGQVASGATVPNTTTTLGNYPDVNAFTVLPANVYGSGKPDFLIPDIGTTPGILAVKNTSTATTYSFATPVRTASPGLTDARPGNFTGTPFSDIALSSATGITVLANDGAGNFTAGYSTLTALLPAVGQSIIDPFAVADANSDTYSDIYTASTNASGGLDLNVSLVSGSATATAAPITLGIGTKDVSAVWPGNVNFASSTATGSQTVQGVPSVTVLSSKNPANLGDPVSFTVSVAPLTASTIIPTGVVTVQQNGNSIGGGTLDSTGAFSFTTTQNVAGSFPIRAAYGGDNFFAGAVSTILTQVVNQAVAAAPTLTWLTPAPITDATPLSATQLDAAATDANGSAIPGTYVYTPAAGSNLSAGTQTLSVTFTPSDTASFTTATKTVQIMVTFGSADNLSPSTVMFPNQTIRTASKPVTINVNVMTVPQGSITIAGDFTQTNDCGGSSTYIYATNCQIQVTFTPTAAGTRTGILSVTPPGGGTPLTVALSGLGLPVGTLPNTTSTALNVTGTVGSYTFTGRVAGNLGIGAPSGSVAFLDSTANNAFLGMATLGPATITTGLANGPSTPTGGESSQVATADFNGDGKPDVVVLNIGFTGNTDPSLCDLNIRLSNGDGTFTSKPDLPLPYCTYAMAVGDFNGDGKQDIALSPSGTEFIVYFGNGDGTFTKKSIPFSSDRGISLAAGDFNGDGRSDLVVGTVSPNNNVYSTTVLLSQSDETFLAGTTNQVASDLLVVGDFNGDGKQDYTSGSPDGIAVFLGNGDGTFQNPADTPLPVQSFYADGYVSTGDFNGDGKADIVLAGSSQTPPYTDAYLVLISKGDGTFTVGPPVAASTAAQGTSDTPSVAAGDFNGDGLGDFAYLDDFAVQVFLSNGDGTFTLAASADAGNNGTGSSDYLPVAAADFNGDGLPDIIGVDSDTSLATVIFTQRTETSTATLANIAVLGTGNHLIEAVYAGDSKFLTSTSATVTVQSITQVTPTLTWPIPASIAYGVPLGAVQLDATVTGINGAALPGTFTYTPPAGTILTPGTYTLTVRFVPADAVHYLPVSGTVSLLVTGLLPTSVTPSTIPLGSGNTTVTITGAGFVATSIVQVNGTTVPTTLVNPTTLTAIIPAADLIKEGTLQVVVFDPTINQTSPALTVTVIPASPQVTLSGPSTVIPGTQPTLAFALTNPYPVTLNGDFDLSFAPAVNPPVDDPAVQFATGGRTLSFTVPADSTAVPKVQLQSGTVAGTITVPLLLTANGLNVTPSSIQPVVIVIPAAVPAVSSATMTKSGDQLTVVLHGFSNTREVTQATFHFVGISGAQIDTPDVTVPVGPAFTAWYSSAASDQYGSTFTYTQTFTVGGGAASIDSVQVTLTNSVGASVMQTAQ